jgi:hypothetical protein
MRPFPQSPGSGEFEALLKTPSMVRKMRGGLGEPKTGVLMAPIAIPWLLETDKSAGSSGVSK